MNRPQSIPENVDGSVTAAAKPVEQFPLSEDPLTGWPVEPETRPAIPVYDAVTGELREFLP